MINLPCKIDTKFVPNLNLHGPVKIELWVKEVMLYGKMDFFCPPTWLPLTILMYVDVLNFEKP